MKKFIIKVLLFSSFCALFAFAISYIIDPYNVFHWNNIRNNGVEPNNNYIKTKYIISNPDKYDGYLFGSSRVGAIHVDNIPDFNIYNMNYSMGLPEQHYSNLITFLNNGVNIDIVYIGVDSYSYTVNPEKIYKQLLRMPYQYLEKTGNLLKSYVNPTIAVQSLATILKGNDIIGIDELYTYGWTIDYDMTSTIDWANAVACVGNQSRLEETLQDIQDIKDLCDANGIELVIFTNPMYKITYEASVEIDYLEFLERLTDITDYYNFSGINDVTINTDNFYDSSHYNAYVGDMIIDAIINGKVDDELYEQGFGWHVTSENIDDLLDILNR